MDSTYRVTVRFDGTGITQTERGPLLLEIEKLARRITDKPVEVFMDRMGDDSKLRRSMTVEQRARL